MKLLMTAIIFFLAYRYLEEGTLLRKVLLVWTGIVLGLNILGLFFNILGALIYFGIVAAIIIFIIGLVKKLVG